ncbi:uncharacterized protein [Panulirus ornatus]|uniref:uncharacterized protein isoform X1 n=2 Tax=Panulirus ornatus TaxID=150431 RepID=UPI003A863B8F
MFTTRELVLSLLLLCVTRSCQENPDSPSSDDNDFYDESLEDDSDGGDSCQPAMADTCFSDVSENLLCHVLTPVGRNCTFRNAKDFCEGLDDALNCTSDIVDSGCTVAQGRQTFDVWLAGLRAVHASLCNTGDLSLITSLLQSSSCWRFKKFIKCVEEKANVTHVSDLLTTELDTYECNRLQLSVALCNALSEKNRVPCLGKADAVKEALVVFFGATSCGQQSSSLCTTQSVGSVGSAVVVTIVVMALVTALAAIILLKHKVLALDSRLKHCTRTSTQEDMQEDYDRF